MTNKEQIAMAALQWIANRNGHMYYVGIPDGYSAHHKCDVLPAVLRCDFTVENAVSIAADALQSIEEAGGSHTDDTTGFRLDHLQLDKEAD